VDAAEDVAVIKEGESSGLSWIAAVRAVIARRVGDHVPGPAARAVMRALLLGDRGGISETTRDRFAATGLLHLLAISGLHVLLVGMTLYTLMRPMLMRLCLSWHSVEWIRASATLALLSGFALLTGAR
jgi:competence protein ComEC